MTRAMPKLGAGALALAALLLAPGSASGARAAELLLRVGDLAVPAGTAVHGDAVAVGGTLDVEGAVDGNAVALGGSIRVAGRVAGSVHAVGGSVLLRPTAVVGGTATAWPGPVRIEPGASVGGAHPAPAPAPPQAPAPPIPLPGPRVPFPAPGSQPFPGPPFQWWWGPGTLAVIATLHLLYWLAVLVALLGFVGLTWLTAVLFPGVLADLAALLERAPGPALGVGLLGWVLLWPAIVVLAVTVVGLLLAVLIPAIVLVMLQFGIAAVALLVGRRVRPSRMGREVVVGAVVLAIAFAIPHLGALLVFAAATWGWGAVLLALLDRGRMRRVPPPAPPAPASGA